MIDIIYEDNHILLINKPINVPMVPDSSKDPSVYDLVKKDLITRYQKKGDAYVGIVQRLDRPVGGLCLIAKTSKAASRLSKEISEIVCIKNMSQSSRALLLKKAAILRTFF